MISHRWPTTAVLFASLAAAGAALAPAAVAAQSAQATPAAAPHAGPTYAELVELASEADLVMRVAVEDQATVKAERAPGLQQGMVRLYLETATEAVLGAPRQVRE